MGGHKHYVPLPNWIKAIDKLPRSKVIVGVLGASCVISGFCTAIVSSGGTVPSTMSKDWQDATQEYMKFQKMNPIFGISRGIN